jgi:hypothetical protein
MRGLLRTMTGIATTSLMLSATLVGVAAPARAADIPAYGVITIADSGTGFLPTWTYDPATWTCRTTVEGQFPAPTAVTVACDSTQDLSFACPLMVLTTHTGSPAARAGGQATCQAWSGTSRSLDTGMVSGENTALRSGDLGGAASVECRAYGGGVPMIPPYAVTCNEPGLPGAL